MQGVYGSFGQGFNKKYQNARGINEICLPEGAPPIEAFLNFFAERRLEDGSSCRTRLGELEKIDNR